MISDYFKLKALDKRKRIHSIRTREEREALRFVKQNVDQLVKRFATLNQLNNKQSADLLTNAMINRYFPNIEEEMFDLIEGEDV